MKISRDWLSDFIDWIETDPEVISDRMTRSMGEVDEIERKGALMENVVVGRVATLGKHPNADTLSICTVETDRGVKHVVCGGTNLREDMLVAFAHVGATVKAGGKEMLTLQKVKIRGEESEGMICASEELEIESLFPVTPDQGKRPIADLSPLIAQNSKLKAGTPLREALDMNDVIFHIDNHAITNRPDLFSHIGVAREMVAMGLAHWKKRPTMPTAKFGKTPPPFSLKNDAGDLIPYYEAALLQVDGSGPSPEWMQRRLIATGWSPFNLMVDVTNYVLMEVGMPLHAFDADDFRGQLHIRKAKQGETMTTLDKKTRELQEGALVISDDDGIFDLFGVMGGLRTSQKPTTRNVFLQAGIVSPVSVRRTVIAMGHRTDAATVYEKGVLPCTASLGLRRAMQLLAAHAPGGCSATAKLVTWGKASLPKSVKTTTARLTGTIGVDIAGKTVKKILTDLGCELRMTGKVLTIQPPAWRRDITHVQDVAEEVARIYGYANVTPVMPEASILPPIRDHRISVIREGLKEQRATELLHLAFTSPTALRKVGADEKRSVEIENPIGEEVSRMRQSLVPSLLETAGREIVTCQTDVMKVYEYGHVFAPSSERSELVTLTAAKGKTTLKDDPLLIAKADITHAMKKAGYTLRFTQAKKNLPAFAHAGRSALITVKEKAIGLLTEVSPSVRRSFDLQGRTAVVVIDLDALLTIDADVTIATPLPAFPAVEFDETLELPKDVFGAVVEKLLTVSPLLRSIVIINLYEGEIGKRVTLRFTYRADDRTLTQEEVEKIHATVLGALKKAS